MEIDKASWHYRAWAWSYAWDGSSFSIPSQTNLCAYVRRLLIGVPFNGFIYGAVFLVMSLIFLVGNLLLGPFGYYVRHPLFAPSNDEHVLQTYAGLRLGNFRLLPWHVLLPTFLVLLGWWNYHIISQHNYPHNAWFITEILFGVVGMIMVLIFLCSTKGNLVREYIDAKTKGICPLIEFKDKQ